MVLLHVEAGKEGLAYKTGYEVLAERGLAIVGMSPGNSYFNRETIDTLLRTVSTLFSQVRIMIPDQPAEHTYKALGYSLETAERKARLAGNALQNRSQRSIDALMNKNQDADMVMIKWKETITTHPAYQRELGALLDIYTHNDAFKKEVRDTTRKVLEPKLDDRTKMESALDEGVHYLLKELAFCLSAPELFGVPRVTYVYHSEWPIADDLLAGKFDGKERKKVGMVILK